MPSNFMQAKYSVTIKWVGIVYIDHRTGALSWERQIADPVIKSYVKKYLCDEGFVEQALAILDPVINDEVKLLLKSVDDFSA
ncbi:MAG: hypothetical protein JO279_01590 [Verrucomicrobia bacterium]|nr:hypothetical protein [Verrucomicrobiota bacterium]MBV8375675.1 hypothetical protein [Verrucomicrobiota bacterium]